MNGRLTAWADGDREQYVWHVQTKQTLAPNQNVAAVVSPAGIFSDQSRVYYALAFGGKFVLEITGGGTAIMSGHNGSAWIDLQDFDLAAGGVNLDRPYQVSFVFTSRRFMTVYFTQSSANE